MAFKPGYLAWIMLDGANGAGTNVSAYADDFSFPSSTEMLETTTFGSSVKRFIPGLAAGDTVSMSGPMDVAIIAQLGSMVSAQAAGTAGFSLIFGPGGSVSGQPKFSAEVLVAQYTLSNGVGGRAEYSASLQVDGAIATATW